MSTKCTLTCALLSDGGLRRGKREGGECLDFVTGFSERCILQLARVHHRHTPPPPRFQIRLFSSAADIEQNPETGYQLHVTLVRGPRNAVLSPKSTVCYWELGSCVCRVNLIFQRGRREKQGLPNGSHSFPLPGKEERQAGKVAATSTSSRKSK